MPGLELGNAGIFVKSCGECLKGGSRRVEIAITGVLPKGVESNRNRRGSGEFSSDAKEKGVKKAARTQYHRFSDIAGQTPEEYKETQQKASKWFGDKLLPPLPDE